MKQKLFFCKVYSDDATAIHYGVKTCEACNVFFRRFLNKHKTIRTYTIITVKKIRIIKMIVNIYHLLVGDLILISYRSIYTFNKWRFCSSITAFTLTVSFSSFKSCEKCTLVYNKIIMNKILLSN